MTEPGWGDGPERVAQADRRPALVWRPATPVQAIATTVLGGGIGLRSWMFHATSLNCIALCLSLWIRAKTVGQEARGNAERRAVFVGLWPPMFWLIGDALERHERPVSRLRLPGTARPRR